ncbi:MAG: PAS domain-containing sensor histidine kinase [Burkholderiaceae bacterium]
MIPGRSRSISPPVVDGSVRERYHAAKFADQRAFSASLGFASCLVAPSLWIWDRVVDPVHAPETLLLRLLMGALMLAYPLAVLAGVARRRLLPLMVGCAFAMQLLFAAILDRLDGGALLGPGGYLFFQLIAPLIMIPFPPRGSVLAVVGLFVLPLAASFAGLPAGLDRSMYLVMNGAAALVAVFSVLVLDRLTLRNYLGQVELQRLSERALEDSQRQYRAIFDGAVEGIFRIAPDGRFEAANPALAALLGYESPRALGEALPSGFYQAWSRREDVERCVAALERDGLVRRFECPMTRRDGLQRWCQVNARLVRDAQGRPAGVEGFVQDVTDQHEATQARERALVAAEDLARARREFIANVSHELRTPLNGVLGYAQIGQAHCGDAQKTRKAFDAIADCGQRLAGVVDSLLDFSRLETGRLVVEPVATSPRTIVDGAAAVAGERARAKGLAFSADCAPDLPERCVVDPQRLRQVLDIVLDNALKFTSGGRVSLWAGRAGADVVLRIADTGIGMDDDQVRRLFTPFRQADGSATRPYGGSGLGLALAARLLDLMGGRIDVASAPGAGTTVEVRFPCAEAASAGAAAPAA